MERLGDSGPPLSKSGGELITEITHTRKWQGDWGHTARAGGGGVGGLVA